MNKRHSVKRRLTVASCTSIFMALTLMLWVSYQVIEGTLDRVKKENMQLMVEDTAGKIAETIDKYLTVTNLIANDQSINNPDQKWSEKLAEMQRLVSYYSNEYGILSIGYIDTNGLLRTTDDFENIISEREYFKDLMANKTYVSSPSYNAMTGKQIIFFGRAIVIDGQVVGAVTCSFDGSFVSNLIQDVDYFGAGTSYIINKQGIVIGSKEAEQVENQYNLIVEAEVDASLQETAEVHKKMIAGESGIEVVNDGTNKFLIYTPIKNSNGWSMAFEIPVFEVNKDLYKLAVIITMIGFVMMGLLCVAIYVAVSRVTNRIIEITKMLKVFATGDYRIQIDERELALENEFGDIYRAVEDSAVSMKKALSAVRDNVIRLEANAEDLEQVSGAIIERSSAINIAMEEAATGNSDQAGSIAVVNSNMEELGENINRVNSCIEEISRIADQTEEEIVVSTEVLNELKASLEEVMITFESFLKESTDMSSQIGNISRITDTIKEIASQTSLLALNAAIESARAGEAGRGFAVVAEEIGHLAEASGNSVDEIGTLINSVLESGKNISQSTGQMNEKMKLQQKNVETTIQAFGKVTKALGNIIPKTAEIAAASKDSMAKKEEVSMLIGDVSAVSEELSATTEEVAATAEEFVATSHSVKEVSAAVGTTISQIEEQIARFQID